MTGHKLFDLGLVDYKEAWQFQKRIFKDVKDDVFSSALILCRHYPVITLGRAAKKENITTSREDLRIRKIDIYQVERGGDVTYHGPGQVTVYPIFNLGKFKKDIHWFLRKLEDLAVGSISGLGAEVNIRPGLTGVWAGESKVCSIGIAVKNWITFHGFSINIKEDDLENFGLIKPCGMNIKMTSLESLLGRSVNLRAFKKGLINRFKYLYN